jgi:hypothetical protein
MGAGNFKPFIIAVSAVFSALIYTKKRLKKESRLKAIHSKVNNDQNLH